VVNPEIKEGDVLTLVWGEENGGTKKPTVERHNSSISASRSPRPYAKDAREPTPTAGEQGRRSSARARHAGRFGHGADEGAQGGPGGPLADLLRGYSAEVTAHDRKGLDAAAQLMSPGAEVFIACLPGESADRLIAAAALLRRAGLVPVPHLVARNIDSRITLTVCSNGWLRGGAGPRPGARRDRDKPEGSSIPASS